MNIVEERTVGVYGDVLEPRSDWKHVPVSEPARSWRPIFAEAENVSADGATFARMNPISSSDKNYPR